MPLNLPRTDLRDLPSHPAKMAEEELPDFDEAGEAEKETKDEPKDGETKKGNYGSIHASGFRDFLLKPELRAT